MLTFLPLSYIIKPYNNLPKGKDLMRLLRNSIFSILFVWCFIFTSFSCTAKNEKKAQYNPLQKISTDILSVSYRGDTSLYPENSLEGIESAFKKGADMVSVNVMKTKDGVFVLCENESLNNICDAPFGSVSEAEYNELIKYTLYDNSGNKTEYHVVSAEEAVRKTSEEQFLIFDFEWQDRDLLYELAASCDALERVMLRTKQSARVISEWVQTKQEMPLVIGIYDGGIIFNAISHINTLSEIGMPLVQYQSKNYFNVMYEGFVNRNYNSNGKAAAIAACYDPDLCGQRTDSEYGWDSLINRGFTVIESVNIDSLVSYINNRETATKKLQSLLKRAQSIDKSKYASVSLENFNKAYDNANAVLENGLHSLDEIQNASSRVLLAMNNMMIKTGDDTQKGALNITGGKIAAAVFVAVGILAGEIFVHKMHVKRRKEN